jgi:hypothetical protein
MKVYLRQPKITFSKDFVNTIKKHGIVLTRGNKFIRNGVMINHGNPKDIKIGRKVNTFYLINKPNYIKYCSNKAKNIDILKKYYPKTFNNVEDIKDKDFPIIAKPLNGHHGYGIEIFDDITSLSSFVHSIKEPYILQRYIPIKHEYRFNVFDKTIYQVSHKQKLDARTDKGGLLFSYRSLGSNAGISDKFWNFIDNVIKDFHDVIDINLGDYCIDVIKGQDKEYYLSEINSAYGIGNYTLEKLITIIDNKIRKGELEKYRVV